MNHSPEFIVWCGVCTHTGRTRRNNEDDHFIDVENRVYIVADGMGGHSGGEIASSLAVSAASECFASHDPAEERPGVIKATFARTQEALVELGEEDPTLRDMGTTMVLVHIDAQNGVVWIGHVGDSRVYRVREGKIEQLTKDHGMIDELVIRFPDLPREKLQSLFGHVVARCLSADRSVNSNPDIGGPYEATPGDIYLLCSDGLSDPVLEGDLLKTLLEHKDPQKAADSLVSLANKAGGPDNITALVLRIEAKEV